MNPYLERYLPLVDFLAEVLGKDAEVVLHDTLDIDRSIVAIRNNHVSGRELGAPATNLVLRILRDGRSGDRDYLANYRGLSASGKALRSSTYFLRDEERRIVGLLCVNVDNDKLLQLRSFIDGLIQAPDPGSVDAPVERFSRTVENLSIDSIEAVIGEAGVSPERLSTDEKQDVVRRLDDEGVFLLKGTIAKVAARLRVSEATVYRYLNAVRRIDTREKNNDTRQSRGH